MNTRGRRACGVAWALVWLSAAVWHLSVKPLFGGDYHVRYLWDVQALGWLCASILQAPLFVLSRLYWLVAIAAAIGVSALAASLFFHELYAFFVAGAILMAGVVSCLASAVASYSSETDGT